MKTTIFKPSKFRSQSDEFDFSMVGEKPTQKPSLTVQGQSLSIQELMNRHLAGSLPPIQHDVDYGIAPSRNSAIDPTMQYDYITHPAAEPVVETPAAEPVVETPANNTVADE